MINYF